MSKLSFRARALDASKPMPIFMAEELPDLPDYSAINRAVPQMPSGMEKEEECEHHLQRAICAGLIIPTPEVSDIPQKEFYDKVYPASYKQPRQLIHMQPFSMEQDIPDYDMDSEDERWLQSQTQRLELSPLKFEEMMDKLEKSSGQTVVTLNEAKALLKEDDDLIIAVFDYWLNKRLKTQHPLILSVRTEQRAGTAANNPYLAFRRRTEKMQTRKNRKNDEASYEKMLKLRRDFCRTLTLLELVKRREKMKREHVHLTVEIFEKRYQAKDFNGAIYNDLMSTKVPSSSRPAFSSFFHNHYPGQPWTSKSILKDDQMQQRKEKRQYKKRKHKALGRSGGMGMEAGAMSSDDDQLMPLASPEPEDVEEEGHFAFRRNKLCSYHMPLPRLGNWPWYPKEENGSAESKYRYNLTSITSSTRRRCIGFARRRVGRGGRVLLDRASSAADDEFWRSLDFTILGDNEGSRIGEVKNEEESNIETSVDIKTMSPTEEKNEMHDFLTSIQKEWLHFRPKTPPPDEEPICNLLPAEESYWKFGSSSPISMEIQSLDKPTPDGVLFDSSVFLADPFAGLDSSGLLDTPITDTRQSVAASPNDAGKLVVQTGINLNVNVGIDTLNSSNSSVSGISKTNKNSSGGISDNDDEDMLGEVTSLDSDSNSSYGDCVDERTIGCSKFSVTDTSFSPIATNNINKSNLPPRNFALNKLNNSVSPPRSTTTTSTSAAANGILPQYNHEKSASRTKLSYAYSGGMEFANNAGPPGLSLHTSAHTLTLNSHSANIFEIPLSNTQDAVTTNLVNAPCTETNTATSANNNKNKTIVRKNNMVMEVT